VLLVVLVLLALLLVTVLVLLALLLVTVLVLLVHFKMYTHSTRHS
jgi:hypothetical protein